MAARTRWTRRSLEVTVPSDSAQATEAGNTTTDYPSYLTLCRWHKRLKENAPRIGDLKSVKLAVLGGATTDMLEGPLNLAVESVGLGCRIHCAPYNLFVQEMLKITGQIQVLP